MSILYDNDTAKTSTFNPSLIQRMNPNSQWANHSYNYIVLQHIAKASDNFAEHHQARLEMEIADRKMTFWTRHPEFDQDTALSWRKKLYRM